MEMIQQPPTQFLSSVDFWTNEISGNIARVNDAAAMLEFDLYKPTATNNKNDLSNRIAVSGNFIKAFNLLYKNVSQVLPHDIKKEVGEWLKLSMKYMAISGLIDTNKLFDGINLAERMQDVLYEIGLKEIGVDDPEEFPYEHYRELVNDVTNTKTAN